MGKKGKYSHTWGVGRADFSTEGWKKFKQKVAYKHVQI